MITLIDRLLNKITMYRLVLYFLIVLLAVAAIFGAFHLLPYSPVAIIFSTLILVVVAWASNGVFARLFKAQPNSESSYITALILALIITPAMPSQGSQIEFLVWAAIFAMASKYILEVNKKHLFNPAAFAVVLTAFLMGQYASWWVGGNLPLLAFVLVGGLLITRKIQRFDLVLSFFVFAIGSIIFTKLSFPPLQTLEKAIVHTCLLFFGFIMITEPATTPPTRALRIAYGALVGTLFAPAIHIGGIYSTPELALVVGNIFSYAVSPKKKYILSLKEKREVGTDTYEFVFAGTAGARDAASAVNFKPGQYMEWTLATNTFDGRGNRRYFTIASSPTESDVRLGVKFYEPSSSFKKSLMAMEPGDKMIAGQLAGDFTLPSDTSKKLVFIAGGIGVTPFRSMVKYLSDRAEKRDVVMLYSNRAVAEIAYREIFDEAEQKIGMKTIYAITDKNELLPREKGHHGRIDSAFIKSVIPDYHERMFYISGTHAMVSAFQKTLHELGVPRTQIKTDFFPGFA
jgi:glycine betaine catabolism B